MRNLHLPPAQHLFHVRSRILERDRMREIVAGVQIIANLGRGHVWINWPSIDGGLDCLELIANRINQHKDKEPIFDSE
ncbi:MAG TPA: hypothetical protein VHX20_17150 [Terracidiphilus sp.]|nr:hypothetical protein [Terracidiphilus sp.]